MVKFTYLDGLLNLNELSKSAVAVASLGQTVLGWVLG